MDIRETKGVRRRARGQREEKDQEQAARGVETTDGALREKKDAATISKRVFLKKKNKVTTGAVT